MDEQVTEEQFAEFAASAELFGFVPMSRDELELLASIEYCDDTNEGE